MRARSVRSLACLAMSAALVGSCSADAADGPATSASAAGCVLHGAASRAADVTLRIDAAGSCADGFRGTMTLDNRTAATCSGDILASVTPGDHRMWFESDSGEGGERGRWVPIPDPGQEGVGLMTYPPGERSWAISVPPLAPDRYTFVLSITCGTAIADAVAGFEVVAD